MVAGVAAGIADAPRRLRACGSGSRSCCCSGSTGSARCCTRRSGRCCRCAPGHRRPTAPARPRPAAAVRGARRWASCSSRCCCSARSARPAPAGWLVAIIALGAGIIWHQADPERRRQWSETLPQVPWLGAVRRRERPAGLPAALHRRRRAGRGRHHRRGRGLRARPANFGAGAQRRDLRAGRRWPASALVAGAGAVADVQPAPRRARGRASASRSGPSSPRWCTTRCCTRSR